jgi:predicted lipoprotein with Yx(FWY)xxD motif
MTQRHAPLQLLLTTMLVAACAVAPTGASPTASPTDTAAATPSSTATASAPATSAPATSGAPSPTATVDDYPDGGYGGRTPPPASGDSTVTVITYGEIGRYLAGPTRMALYTFDNDGPGASSCSASCAETWPPLTVPAGEEPVAGPGISGELDVIAREDGSYQVIYNAMPLYYYAGDSAVYDTTGDGVGGVWHLARP